MLHLTGRIARIGTGLCDVLGDYTTSSNHNIITDTNRHDGGVCPNAHTIADSGLFPLGLITASGATDSEWVVDEHGSVTDEAFLANSHKFADERMTLYSCACTNRDSALNLNEGPNEHTVAQCAPVKVDRFDQCDILAELNVDDAVLVDSGLAHDEGGVNLSLEWVGCIMLKACR